MQTKRSHWFGTLATVVVLGITAAPARADLVFEQPAIDFGQVHTGQLLEHRCRFRNQGPAAVAVVAIKTGCGCLKVESEPPTLRPGEMGHLLVRLHTLSATPGRQAWRIHLHYRSGAAERDVELSVSAQVVQEIIVQPPALLVSSDRSTQHELGVIDLRPQPLRVLRVEGSAPYLQARLTGAESDAAGRLVQRIQLEIGADAAVGRHEEHLTIHTDDPVYRELKVPVTVHKKARQRVTAVPPRVAVVASAGQPAPSRIVTLRDSQREPLVIERVVADDPAITCTWPEGVHPVGTVKITVDRAKVAGEQLTSQIEVFCRQPGAESVVIPVSCTVR
jgi:hypothetical protein